MGALTFDEQQLRSIGAITLDGFAACLAFSLARKHVCAAEQALVPLPTALVVSMKRRFAALTELGTCTCGESEPASEHGALAPKSSALAQLLAHPFVVSHAALR